MINNLSQKILNVHETYFEIDRRINKENAV